MRYPVYQSVVQLLVLVVLCFTPVVSNAAVTLSGSLQKWAPLTVDNEEARLSASDIQTSPNPFLDYRFNVVFTSPTGEVFTVPGFYAGDGNGGSEGALWRVRFSPDETGVWNYRVSFRSGINVAVELPVLAGVSAGADGEVGSFTVTEQAEDAPGFLKAGRLGYDGSHYLKFADAGYWIKGGVDSPENFFGFAGFDNTEDQSGGAGTSGLSNGVHQYASHVNDWQTGDPEFANSESGHSGRAIVGAVNYLSSQGVNSIYFLPMNLGGDGRETYPFVGPSGSDFDNTHYDVSKLFQWNLVLQHMQNKGIAAHVVLAEVEGGNTNWFDNGSLGVERKLYYREMIARFSYLLALKWNLSEESQFGVDKHKEFAAYIRALDWADHPVAVHTHVNKPAEMYDPLLGDVTFDITSIQFGIENADQFVEDWRRRSMAAGWPWVIDMDEVAPASEGLTDTNSDALRKSVLYPVYFSGGNIEWYFGYHGLPLGGDMRTEDFRTRESMYRYMRIAREFMLAELPFWEMQPNDSLHSEGDSTDIQVFEKPGSFYAVYLPDASVGGRVAVDDGEYGVRWFDPRQGRFSGEARTLTGDSIEVGMPPDTENEDWILLIKSADEVTPDEPDLEAALGAEEPDAPLVDSSADPSASTTGSVGGGAIFILLPFLLVLRASQIKLTRHCTIRRVPRLV